MMLRLYHQPLRKKLRGKSKREALNGLIGYIARRLEMLDYPRFVAAGYDIGSGPTEAFCKTLTSRLKGPGMRWDKPHAEALMALASIRSSRLWNTYWQKQRQILHSKSTRREEMIVLLHRLHYKSQEGDLWSLCWWAC